MSHESSATLPAVPEGLKGVTADWSADKQAFPVPWGKAMMWIFLLSDTFIFSCFLISYMNVRISTTDQWPNPSEVFSLTVFGTAVPLFLIAIMTMILITSSGTMAMAVNFGYRRDRKKTALLMQNGGLLNSCNGLTTTALQFGVPILLLIYYAGDIGDNAFHMVGLVTEPVLHGLGIKYVVLRDPAKVKQEIAGAVTLANSSKRPVALLLTRAVL